MLSLFVFLVACDTPDTTDTVVCDIPADLRNSCAGSGCHAAAKPAADLDLESPGLAQRVAEASATQCVGLLAERANPVDSVLYTKLTEDNACGARMPIGGDPWTEPQMDCLEAWIAALEPPEPIDTSDPCPGCTCEPETVEACYAGRTGTIGNGACVAGERECDFDGEWGACEGQVLPSVEDCTTNEDEDCDGATLPCSLTWTINVGTDRSQSLRSLGVDSSGNIFVTGDFQDTVDFGTGPLESVGDKSDIMLAKYNPNGVPLWTQRFGDSSNQYATKLHVDANGDVLILGRAFGKIDFGGGELDATGTDDVYIAKLDSDGNHVWSRLFGGLDPDRAERMTTDSAGDVYVTGTFTGTADFGNGDVTSAGARDAFLLKLEGVYGGTSWSQILSATGDAYGFGVTTDADDNVYVAVRYLETLTNQTQSVVSNGATDIALARFDTVGVLTALHSFGGSGDDRVHDLVLANTDGTPQLVMVGHFENTIDFGGDALESAGSRDIFVTSLDLDGGHNWGLAMGDETDQFESDHELNTWLNLEAADDGTVWVAGAFSGELPFVPVTLTSAGKTDIFLIQLDGKGSYLGAGRYGEQYSDYLLDFDLIGSELIPIVGRHASRPGFSLGVAGEVKGAGSFDGFVAQIPQW